MMRYPAISPARNESLDCRQKSCYTPGMGRPAFIATRILAALLAVGTPCSPASAALDCRRAPRKALPGLIKRALKSGQKTVLQGAPALVAGWNAPVAMLIIRDGDRTHMFEVLVRQGPSGEELIPTGILLIDMTKTRDARQVQKKIFLTGLSGALESAGFFHEDSDENGEMIGGDHKRLGPHDPRSASEYARSLAALCRLAAKGTRSMEEELETMQLGTAEEEGSRSGKN